MIDCSVRYQQFCVQDAHQQPILISHILDTQKDLNLLEYFLVSEFSGLKDYAYNVFY
jgi:hypothetical protein